MTDAERHAADVRDALAEQEHEATIRIAATVSTKNYALLKKRAARIGLSASALVTMAIDEYLVRHVIMEEENLIAAYYEREELKKSGGKK